MWSQHTTCVLDLQILFNITGCCRPKEVLALMGPSGSGKTTLLSIIGSRAQRYAASGLVLLSACLPACHDSHKCHAPCSAMRRTGAITFNGQKLNKRFKRQIGFVMQASTMHAACLFAFTSKSLHTMWVHHWLSSKATCVCILCCPTRLAAGCNL